MNRTDEVKDEERS